ncbi:MAG: glycosyltransferase family 4 protein [Oscillospiraceae bacterium]|jgi:1,2-diacylglycerol 3-alpha-glucosyltransferase|nr:glycosyltransferase family 4 protein [Oscillospiraceae bacterium]
MKIALFTDAFYPTINGVATSVLMLKDNLEAEGHEVLVVTTADPGAPYIEENIVRIPSVPFKTQRLGTLAGPKIHKDVRKFSPDIIHTHTEFTLGNLGQLMARRLKVPHVHTMHTVWEYYTEYIIRIEALEPAARVAARKLTALFCNFANRVIVPTTKVQDLLYSYGVKKEISVIPSGIDLDKFSEKHITTGRLADIREELGIKADDRILLSIGRTEREKNIDVLINSLSDYLKKNKHVKLVIVGDGTARVELEELAEELGISKQVIFAGQRPWEEICVYYKLGDIFVGASESESQGLTYVEAMASGVPVIAKEDRCLEGTLIVDENGYMFKDKDELVAAIDKILSDSTKHKQLSEKAKQTAEGFSSKSYAVNVINLYKELV